MFWIRYFEQEKWDKVRGGGERVSLSTQFMTQQNNEHTMSMHILRMTDVMWRLFSAPSHWIWWRYWCATNQLGCGISLVLFHFSKAYWLCLSCFGPFISFSKVIWIYFISINNNNTKMPITRANNHQNQQQQQQRRRPRQYHQHWNRNLPNKEKLIEKLKEYEIVINERLEINA